jgi:hypothetical protein
MTIERRAMIDDSKFMLLAEEMNIKTKELFQVSRTWLLDY